MKTICDSSNFPQVHAQGRVAREGRTIPKELKTLCARLAHERCKQIAWANSKTLRIQVAERIAAGETETAVAAWLVGELVRAAGEQVRP